MYHQPGDTVNWEPKSPERGKRRVSEKQNAQRFPGEAAALSGVVGQAGFGPNAETWFVRSCIHSLEMGRTGKRLGAPRERDGRGSRGVL